jgi:pimeloyl-ACP methyl ester carboxylesterase
MEQDNTIATNTYGRRRFLGGAGVAALSVGAAQFGLITPAVAQVTGTSKGHIPGIAAATAATAAIGFGPVKQINAGVLNVGYVDMGPADGTPVILMHGFPYDIHSYVDVAPLLAAQGYRAIVPYFRGHGSTTFLSSSTPRNVDQAAFALDIIDLMDALKIDKAIMAGYDWGTRTVNILAALWPQRVMSTIATAGYLITNLAAQKSPALPEEEFAFWYQFYFDTARGVAGLTSYRKQLCELVWKFNSHTWKFDDATYERTAQAFNNPDWVKIVIGNYRWRQSLYPSEPQYADLEAKLQQSPTISQPTITIDGKYDPFTPPGNGSAYRAHYVGKYEHRVFPVGHNVPQEAPQQFAQAVIDVNHL